MKIRFLSACLVFLPLLARAEDLSSADRDTLLEKLDQLLEDAEQKIDAKFRAAVLAYRAAMASPDTAVEFYLKCVQKENFTDLKKKEIEFREWKKKEEAKLKKPAFGLALCHQLRWLVLSLRAASEKTDRNELSRDGIDAMEAVFRDAPSLIGQYELLSQSVMGSVFTRTYGITEIKAKDWPGSPVQISEIFEKIVLPPLRNPERIEALRSAWQHRIQLESTAVTWKASREKEKNTAEKRKNEKESAFGQPSAEIAVEKEQEKFTTEVLPTLRWAMEKDLFAHGDQRGASLRMLNLIQSNPGHKSAIPWAEELRALINPPKEENQQETGNPSE